MSSVQIGHPGPHAARSSALSHRMVIVAGKGGVGRTTVASALAVALARRGRRTLLASVRCRHDLGRLLGCETVGDKIRSVEPNLWAVNMNPRAALREMGLLVLHFQTVYRLVLENRIVRSFLRAVPALDEYSMIGKVWFHTTEKDGDDLRYQTVVFDGPATGHLISMLRIPKVILDAVPDGPLTADARRAHALFSDARQATMWIVTLAEEMAVSEAIDLYRAAGLDLEIDVGRVVVNGLYPQEYGDGIGQFDDTLRRLRRQPLSPILRAMLDAAEIFRARRRINDAYLTEIHRHLPLPVTKLPHLPVPALDRACINTLADLIDKDLP